MTLEQARFQAHLLKCAGFFEYHTKVNDMIMQLDSESACQLAEQADQLISRINAVLPQPERIITPKTFYHGVREEMRFANFMS